MRQLSRKGRYRAAGGVGGSGSVRAFTLVEMLVVVSIVSLLLALLMPVLGRARGQMKKLKCASNMRNISLEFQFFAQGNSAEGKGDSERLGRGHLFINDFQESLYRIDEFWDDARRGTAELKSSGELMLCPAGPGKLTKREGYPCSRQAITPAEGVTLALNMRLYRAPLEVGGRHLLAPVAMTQVRSGVFNHPYAPLVIDVDGETAMERGLEPFYTAPPRQGASDAYDDGRYWMPSDRHGGQTNVAFVGGHVLASEHPGRETWNWDYQADIGG